MATKVHPGTVLTLTISYRHRQFSTGTVSFLGMKKNVWFISYSLASPCKHTPHWWIIVFGFYIERIKGKGGGFKYWLQR